MISRVCLRLLLFCYVMTISTSSKSAADGQQHKKSKQQQQQQQQQAQTNKGKVYKNMSGTGYSYVEKFESPMLAAAVETASTTMSSSAAEHPLNYCSFFNNRAPSPQANLKNCTWYKENSCCLQAEIESTFSKVKPLIGSSKTCQLYLNSLMCYICAPNQYKFYGKERLTVCVEFCNKMFEACGDAILKGSKINEIYSNGERFCQGRRYTIGYLKNDNCFHYNADTLEVSSSTRPRHLFFISSSHHHSSSLIAIAAFFLTSFHLFF